MLEVIKRDPWSPQRAYVERVGFIGFQRLAWDAIEPSQYSENWHHAILAEALERVYTRETRKLSIWVPPGTTKTLTSGVFWPAWVWTMQPERRMIHATYGGKLALKAARQQRDLVRSDWYQGYTKGKVCVPHQNTHAASWFENNHSGFRFSASIGGEVTGRHAHDLVADDLNKAKDARGPETPLDASWEFWSSDLPTRQMDPRLTTRVQIGQRIHVDDVGGRWVRSDPDVEVICLPMWGAPDHPYRHPDDNRKEGELLWPERFGDEQLEELLKALDHNPSVIAAQLQQRPIPPGGQLYKDEYLSHRYDRPTSSIQRALDRGRAEPGQTWGIYADLTFKGKITSDFVVFQLWCREEGRFWLIDQIRGQWGFRRTKEEGLGFASRYPVAMWTRLEDGANAAAMEDDLRGSIKGLQVISHGGGCLTRSQQVEGVWASGAVMLPRNAPWMFGGSGFLAEHLAYDGRGTIHDDQVSCSSLALLDLSGSNMSNYIDALRKL